MKQIYIRCMDMLNRFCLVVSGICIVVMTLIVPYGVFCRYVLDDASSWPEPLAVLLMIVFSFFSACVCYREYLHIGVGILPSALKDTIWRVPLGWTIELCMFATNMFMFWWGWKLVYATWFQVIADFPFLSVGITYLPVPVGGMIVVLFVIERLWTGALFKPDEDIEDPHQVIATE